MSELERDSLVGPRELNQAMQSFRFTRHTHWVSTGILDEEQARRCQMRGVVASTNRRGEGKNTPTGRSPLPEFPDSHAGGEVISWPGREQPLYRWSLLVEDTLLCFSVIGCHSVRGPVKMTRPIKDPPNKRGGQLQTDLGRRATGWAPGRGGACTFPHTPEEEENGCKGFS